MVGAWSACCNSNLQHALPAPVPRLSPAKWAMMGPARIPAKKGLAGGKLPSGKTGKTTLGDRSCAFATHAATCRGEGWNEETESYAPTPAHSVCRQPVRLDTESCYKERMVPHRVMIHISRSERRVLDPDDVVSGFQDPRDSGCRARLC